MPISAAKVATSWSVANWGSRAALSGGTRKLHAENAAEADARQDYDDQVGSEEHEEAVSDAREASGLGDEN